MRRSPADPKLSERLRLRILKRDSWRCQLCGGMNRLEVHHQVFRSHGGGDAEENLITLCRACHSTLHIHLMREK
jgi:5-methylcytosine-specific restriction endonuclease McrA